MNWLLVLGHKHDAVVRGYGCIDGRIEPHTYVQETDALCKRKRMSEQEQTAADEGVPVQQDATPVEGSEHPAADSAPAPEEQQISGEPAPVSEIPEA